MLLMAIPQRILRTSLGRFLALLTIAAMSGAGAQALEPNNALREIAAADQQDRSGPDANIDDAKLSERDAGRRSQVMQLLAGGELRVAEDYFNAALIFHHGQTMDDSKLAFSLISIAAALRPERPGPKAAACSAWDRLMLRAGKPQWYGTQFQHSAKTGTVELSPVDESAATDEDRKACGLPTLQESRANAAQIR
jgi:TPR repeat protein